MLDDLVTIIPGDSTRMDITEIVSATTTVVMVWLGQNLPGILTALLLQVVGWIFARWAGRWVRNVLERSGRMDATVIPVISSVVRYGILIIVVVASLNQLGVPTTSILAALGAAGLAIGLALQGTLANIAAGFMLLWLRPFRVGDYIDAEGNAGTVREIGLFATELDTFDGIYRFVPNSQIWSKAIYNYTRNPARMTDMEVGIAYGADIEKARQIMLDLANGDDRVVNYPEPIVFVSSLDDSAVTLRYRVWIKTADYWGTQRYLLEESKRQFDTAGVEIPFPQRVVHVVHDDPDDRAEIANPPPPVTAPVSPDATAGHRPDEGG